MKPKNVTFAICLLSPLFPALAVLVFNRIGHALPLLIACIVVVAAVLFSIVTLVRVPEKSPGMKIVGAVIGIVGIAEGIVVGLISGWALTKM